MRNNGERTATIICSLFGADLGGREVIDGAEMEPASARREG
jgi:hypothetical protein